MEYFLRHLSNIQVFNNRTPVYIFSSLPKAITLQENIPNLNRFSVEQKLYIYIYIYIYLDSYFLFKINDAFVWLSLEKGIGELNAGTQRGSHGNAENQGGNVGGNARNQSRNLRNQGGNGGNTGTNRGN